MKDATDAEGVTDSVYTFSFACVCNSICRRCVSGGSGNGGIARGRRVCATTHKGNIRSTTATTHHTTTVTPIHYTHNAGECVYSVGTAEVVRA